MLREIKFAPALAGDLHLPETPAPDTGFPAALLIHGGAWCSMDRSSMTGLAEQLCDNGMTVFNIDYRLAKTHKWPCGINDCRAALEWLLTAGTEDFHLDKNNIFVVGGSAGGHYALITGFSAPRGSVAGIISFSGIDNVFPDFRHAPGRYHTLLGYEPAPEDLQKIDPISFYYDGAPPVLCTHFVRDQVVPAEAAIDFAEAVRRRGGKIDLYLYDHGRDGDGHAIWQPGTSPRKLYPDILENFKIFFKNSLRKKTL